MPTGNSRFSIRKNSSGKLIIPFPMHFGRSGIYQGCLPKTRAAIRRALRKKAKKHK